MPVKQVSADTAVAPNLVPMVDIMFLLLLFFMLGADMGQRELEEVLLPKAEARLDDRADVDRVIVNVHRDGERWAVAVRGQDRTAPGALEATLAASDARGVLIRADGDAAYEHVQRVMEACAKAGLAKVELAAAKPAE
jgi:biopolymer transport protein ExbD